VAAQTANAIIAKSASDDLVDNEQVKMIITNNIALDSASGQINQDVWVAIVIEYCYQDGTYEIYGGSIPKDAVMGIQKGDDEDTTVWLDADAYEKIANTGDDETSVDWDTGVITIGNTKVDTLTSKRTVTDEEAANAKALMTETVDVKSYGGRVATIITKEFIMSEYDGDASEGEELWAELVKELCMMNGYAIYTGDIPSGALEGIYKEDTKQIVWVDEADLKKIDETETKLSESGKDVTWSIDWSTGEVTIGDTTIETLTTRTNAANQTPAASSDDGAALLIVGGAVAAAGVATAVYFYTHQAVWQKVVNNVRNVLGLPTTEAAAAEAVEAPETAEVEEAAEAAAPAETSAAAEQAA
jgi:hypothetical protein